MSKDKKKEEAEERSYTGSKDPADRGFAEWVVRQWQRGESLQKIDVIEYFTKGTQKGFGSIVDFEMFGTSREPNLEDAIDLTNRFVGSAQVNCERVHQKEMRYYARAFDKGRSSTAEPVSTWPLHLKPKTLYVESLGGGRAGSGDEEDLSSQGIALRYLDSVTQTYRYDRDREDNNIGDLITMFMNERREQRQWEIEQQKMIRGIMGDWVQAIRDREAALSSELDRLPQREMTKIKAEMLRDGFRTGKNLLTGLVGSMAAPQQQAQPQQEAMQAQPTGGAPRVVVTQMTQERMLLDNFFEDCKNAKLDVALFGEWEKDADGKAKLVKKGIFDPEQFIVLVQVHRGYLTADALDELMPDSGKPLAIKMEQLAAAQALEGMTDGIAMSLVQLVSVRNQKKEATPSASTTPAAPKEKYDV